MSKEEPFAFRAFSPDGTRQIPGPLAAPMPEEEGEGLHALLLANAAAVVGRPLALLGQDGPEVLLVEVLDESGLEWVDAELPVGWRERSPWRQPGWYTATVEVIDAALSGAGLRRTGPAVQTKHWSISALMRVPTDGGDVWFKQVPPMFAHEGRLVGWLAELAPDHVAAPLAVGADWWLAADLGKAVEAPEPLGAVEVLTSLQLISVGREEELLALGCPDRRLETYAPALEALVSREGLLSEDRRTRLAQELPTVLAAVDKLASAGLPSTLVHGDFHGGNQRHTAAGWVIYDWTDGCLAHPLTDLAPAAMKTEGAEERLALTARLWQAAGWPVDDELLTLGRVVGAAHQVITYQRIADGVEPTAAAMWSGQGDTCADALHDLLQLL